MDTTPLNNNFYPFHRSYRHLQVIKTYPSSDGIIHDFSGSKYISIDDFAFGEPFLFVKLTPSEANLWDENLNETNNKFCRMDHNIFTNNCHSHVADFLNRINYEGKNDFNMINIWWMCLTKGKYISWWHLIKTYFVFILLIIVYLKYFK